MKLWIVTSGALCRSTQHTHICAFYIAMWSEELIRQCMEEWYILHGKGNGFLAQLQALSGRRRSVSASITSAYILYSYAHIFNIIWHFHSFCIFVFRLNSGHAAAYVVTNIYLHEDAPKVDFLCLQNVSLLRVLPWPNSSDHRHTWNRQLYRLYRGWNEY